MALRRWRGVLVQENIQTGDGRVMVPGSIEWPALPLALGYIAGGSGMHVNLITAAPEVGNIQTIERVGDDIVATGIMDDAIPEAAELIRRLEAGSAPLGNRIGLSIDPDNWAVEIVDTTITQEDVAAMNEELTILVASGHGPLMPHRSVTAGAGDPDPGEGVGVVLFSNTAGDVLERYTRLRIRGVTACAIGAIEGAYLELDAAEAAPAVEGEVITAAALIHTEAPAPPLAAFSLPEPEVGASDDGSVYGMPVQELLVEQPDGGLGVPFTIVERDGVRWCFGHAALWTTCHVGYLSECVTAPPSMAAYAHFHHGHVVTAEGSDLATGVLTANCDHAAAELLAPEARDHYAHSGMGFADVRASNGSLGVWLSGVLRSEITEHQLRVLRASSLSGDWRRVGADAYGRGGNLEFVAALAVNVPGFPIAREYIRASGMTVPSALTASAHVDNGQVMSLVASGVVQRCADCAARGRLVASADPRLDRVLDLLGKVELRTRHLVEPAAAHARSRFTRH